MAYTHSRLAGATLKISQPLVRKDSTISQLALRRYQYQRRPVVSLPATANTPMTGGAVGRTIAKRASTLNGMPDSPHDTNHSRFHWCIFCAFREA